MINDYTILYPFCFNFIRASVVLSCCDNVNHFWLPIADDIVSRLHSVLYSFFLAMISAYWIPSNVSSNDNNDINNDNDMNNNNKYYYQMYQVYVD